MSKKVTFRITAEMKEALGDAIVTAGYRKKDKSLWFNDAMQAMFLEDAGLSKVGVGEVNSTFPKTETVIITDENLMRIDDAIEIIRRQDPHAEGVKAMIYRAAIRYAMSGFVRSPHGEAVAS